MRTIDFRVRPPFKSFLATAMYLGNERRDRITRQIGFEPSSAATSLSVDKLLLEMDEACVDAGVVVGRVSGALGNVDNADILELCATYPKRFLPIAGIAPWPRKAASVEMEQILSAGFRGVAIEPGGFGPPPTKWSDLRYKLPRRTEDAEQATQARRDCHQASPS